MEYLSHYTKLLSSFGSSIISHCVLTTRLFYAEKTQLKISGITFIFLSRISKNTGVGVQIRMC